MNKNKKSLNEELRIFDHLNNYDKDFTLEESRLYSKEIKNRKYDLKIITESDIKSKKPHLLNEWAPLVGALARIAPWALRGLASIGRGSAALGSRGLLSKLPSWGKSLLGLGRVSTKGLKTATGKTLKSGLASKIASGSNLGAVGKNIPGLVNAQAAKGLGALLTWGTGASLIGKFGSGGGSSPLPGDVVAGQEAWASGQQPSEDDFLSMAFSPEYYDSLNELDKSDSDITVTFQSENEIIQIADALYNAMEGGEKYFGKGIIDTLTFGATEGAGTEEEDVYKSFQAVRTIGDCSYLSKIYQLKYNVPLLENLLEELNESDFQPIVNILRDKPITIINDKKIYDSKDLEGIIKSETEKIIQRPEGMPAYRVKFKSLFDGNTVDLFVGMNAGNATMAIVFYAGKEEYLGQFQYIENSDDKYYFETPDGNVYTISDEEDKAQLAKVFGKAKDEEEASEDIMVLTKDIDVNGTIYETGENLMDIEGPEGTADEYLDELVQDNPTIASRKPTALQGAAIALAMGVKDFEILTESVSGLAEVLGESRLVVEQKYTVNYNREDNKYKINKVRTTTETEPTTSAPTKPQQTPTRPTRPTRPQQTPTPVVPEPDVAAEEEIQDFAGRYSSKKQAEESLENLERINDTKATKNECIAVIGAASKALPTVGGPNTYKVLQYCYDAYNFSGKESRRVKSGYGITGKGDLKNKKRK